MGANKFEDFETVVIHRCQLQGAYYNPRKISETARKKLENFIKENGLWSPLVWNRTTGTLVSGHQRLGVLDSLMSTTDYELTVAAVDKDEETEVKGNVFLNNPSAMGEWDFEILNQIQELFPEIDYVKDLGFDAEEVDLFMDSTVDTPHFADTDVLSTESAVDETGDVSGYSVSGAAYTLTLVFHSAEDKQEFNRLLELPPGARRCTAAKLLRILED